MNRAQWTTRKSRIHIRILNQFHDLMDHVGGRNSIIIAYGVCITIDLVYDMKFNQVIYKQWMNMEYHPEKIF